MTRVYLVRHGTTEWNAAKRAQGQADIPLNEAGLREAARAAEALGEAPIDAVYTSDLERAVRTAERIAGPHRVDVVEDRDLREIDQGDWEGLDTATIRRRWPELWGLARHYRPRPGGESPDAVRERALRALRRIVERHPGGTVAVVSHGGTIRWLSAAALGYDNVASARLRGVGNGGIVAFDAALEDGSLLLSGFRRLDGATPDRDDPND